MHYQQGIDAHAELPSVEQNTGYLLVQADSLETTDTNRGFGCLISYILECEAVYEGDTCADCNENRSYHFVERFLFASPSSWDNSELE
jgi:hypothetical protein